MLKEGGRTSIGNGSSYARKSDYLHEKKLRRREKESATKKLKKLFEHSPIGGYLRKKRISLAQGT